MKTSAELRDLRERAGITQLDFAEIVGCSKRTVQRWEHGEGRAKAVAVEVLRSRTPERAKNSGAGPRFRFIDLFAGIGGMRLGFEAAGGECVFTSEWNRFSQTTYAANFGQDAICGDIRAVSSGDIPHHDVLVAGFPCQPFSVAGVSKKNALGRPHGFACEAQGTLFFEIARILADHQPAAFLLENVKNLASHDGGRTIEVIMNTLEKELNYDVHPYILDAQHWLPQHRERVFLVGFRKQRKFSWDRVRQKAPAIAPKLATILHPENGAEVPEEPYTLGLSGVVNPRYTLSDKLWKYLQDYAEKHRRKGNGFGFGLVGPDDVARTLSARYYKDGSEILVRTGGPNPRRLTPRECARLMGFDSPERVFKIPVSDTQAYKQFGNAVAVPVIEAIASEMLPHIESFLRRKSRRVTLAAANG